jgi:peptidoglycan hydrolase-like protein with peptidoglycan-binding domain
MIAGAQGYAFNANLTVGSTGADVVALQTALMAAGHDIPAIASGAAAKGYFGSQTKAAVQAYQVAKGIVNPGTGFVGPLTRGVLNGSAVVVATGPVVCPVGYDCTPKAGGAPVTGGAGLVGGAGNITVTQTATDVVDKVLTGDTEKVLGLRVEASGSDVRVTNVRVKFTAAVDSSASDRLTSYADKVIIYADGKEVGSLDTSSFIRDSAGVFSASIPVSQIVRMGSGNRVNFHVGFKAVESIDSDNDGSTNDWTALFISMRYEDATGVVLTDSTGSLSNGGIYVDRVSSSSEVKLRMAEGLNNPKTSNIKVSTSDTTDVVLAEFTLKAEGADMYFDQLIASTTITGTTNVSDIASDFYLVRGSSTLAEVAGSTGTSQALTFSLVDTERISSGETMTYKIVAKVKAIASTNTGSTFGGGDTITASTSATVWNINAKANSDGKSITERAGSVTTYTQTLYNEGIAVTKVGEDFTSQPNDTAANVAGEFKVTLKITNFGSNDVYVPLNSLASTTAGATSDNSTKGINFYVTDGTTATTSTVADATVLTGTVSKGAGGVEKTNSVLISGGQSAELVLTTSFNPAPAYTGTRQYRIQIGSVGHAASDVAAATTLIATTPLVDFRTNYQSIQN